MGMKQMQHNSLEPGEKIRAEAWLYEQLKRDILLGVLRPRERLLENELHERFQVGRHVVRAALEALERAGLVERRLNRGALVRDYTEDEIEELYDMRKLLHEAAVERMKFPAKEELIAELERINSVYRENLEQRNLAEVVDANDRFHRTLYASCGNRSLEQTIEEFWLKTAAIHCYAIANPELAQRSLAEHEEMIAAVKAGDRVWLNKVCNDHMYPALEAYRRANGRW